MFTIANKLRICSGVWIFNYTPSLMGYPLVPHPNLMYLIYLFCLGFFNVIGVIGYLPHFDLISNLWIILYLTSNLWIILYLTSNLWIIVYLTFNLWITLYRTSNLRIILISSLICGLFLISSLTYWLFCSYLYMFNVYLEYFVPLMSSLSCLMYILNIL